MINCQNILSIKREAQRPTFKTNKMPSQQFDSEKMKKRCEWIYTTKQVKTFLLTSKCHQSFVLVHKNKINVIYFFAYVAITLLSTHFFFYFSFSSLDSSFHCLNYKIFKFQKNLSFSNDDIIINFLLLSTPADILYWYTYTHTKKKHLLTSKCFQF